MTKGVKRKRESSDKDPSPEVPLIRRRSEEDDSAPKEKKWVNKERVLVLGTRGISSNDRHLMEDIRNLMPHGKGDSKLDRKDSLFSVNEIAEMKNCQKVLLFQGKRKRDLYLWAANTPRGPSANFQVENVHTMSELKMTGNCLKGSRPLLSFDESFEKESQYALMKELLIQIFGVPNFHPKSQPFFDHVYTFAIVDRKIWFRNYQIVEEDGSLAEIGPRFVLNPIKVFESSFSGVTLWENPNYVTPAAHRSILKKVKAHKYIQNKNSKAAYEADRPTGPTYSVDPTDEVFATIANTGKEPTPKTASKKKKPKRKGRGIDVNF